MIKLCSITRLRDNLGKFVHDADYHQDRFLILKNGREVAGLVPVRDVKLLDNATNRSMDYKAYQVAEELMRWRIIKEGMERFEPRG
ncbi:hypothetical protein DS909_20950 [Phaeobacter gallaeciensis]|uniref:Antitoxin n=2 Tax=Roseobacteraceae TaxID=2854170 RepID=A0A366WLI9_9RHOB|nr:MULTISPECIES: type II toxin-antitoxin system Phd/YefM family antitoxin [Roseobacteraceae]MBT3141408.1 type II toxin-antitoxin system Phd/YefM family antitoxin [Falsiruegeria litorea]MBT8167450.1 type II toxin-antitoxin system Phd/YefM family antitoxin [Falsiruegeria litorea]RBW51018.1 hypothetical protein DS909_20950 [Phaeobacter gallaeciensis]